MRSRHTARRLALLAGLSAIALANAQARADGPHPMIPEALRQCQPLEAQTEQADGPAVPAIVTGGEALGGLTRIEQVTGPISVPAGAAQQSLSTGGLALPRQTPAVTTTPAAGNGGR